MQASRADLELIILLVESKMNWNWNHASIIRDRLVWVQGFSPELRVRAIRINR